jgi:hypothetical protein
MPGQDVSATDLQRPSHEAEVKRMGVLICANSLVAAYKAECP